MWLHTTVKWFALYSTQYMCSLSSGTRNASSSAGLPKPWTTEWRKSSRWDTSTGRDAQAVRIHVLPHTGHAFISYCNYCLYPYVSLFCQLGKKSLFSRCMCAHDIFLPTALPKEYQRIGKAFQNLSSVFTSSGYQGRKRDEKISSQKFWRRYLIIGHTLTRLHSGTV